MQTDVVENPHSQKNKPEKKDQNNQKDNFDDHDMAQAKTEPETGHILENRNQNITDDAITMPKVEESKILDKHDNKRLRSLQKLMQIPSHKIFQNDEESPC